MTDSFDMNSATKDWRLGLIGQAPPFLAVMRLIPKLAAWDAPVLIEGETGTGKELAARAIHYGSRRRSKPFVPVNCGAIPESLIENELFGHCRGAFTDAGAKEHGLLRLADQGTLFLDEIDSLPVRGQVALLRFLQDGRYRPLGAVHEETADVRMIVASNRKLETLVEADGFRADLLFRLRVLSIEMPPLRERLGDSLLLANHFLREFASRYGEHRLKTSALDSHTHAWFDSYSWPGNVRELENLVHREFLLSDGRAFIIPAPNVTMNTCPDHGLIQASAGIPPQSYTVARTKVLDAFDKRYLEDLLRHTRGNVSQAARLAGKERSSLGKLLRKHQIDCSRFRDR
ncbi:sigma 54-interacting transcriptional regulator [Pseudomonas sp. R5(2019)]|uniref:sigma 54-interacting transcriptional regulator n=1 Tax=Pseudomonas sp. R5(2019) TaxID=2697566 RepID=UPI001C4982EE|nr:sigma-54 dependent transcriptional regulator [Pseudomonas sp. R5(2019)]